MKTKQIFLTSLFLSCGIFVQAQFYTWSEDIAPIIYENCSSCHHEGGIGSFELMAYEDLFDNITAINHVISEGIMPPWPADPDYMHFVGETVLTDEEVEAILTWLDVGLPTGDMSLAPDPPVFLPSGSLLETIDLTIAIEPYTLQSNSDEYRWFVIDNPSDEPFYISKLEVFAGLDNVVHHADLFLDYSGVSMNYDQLDPLPGFNGNTGFPVNNHYINAWQPGGNVAEYPPGWGVLVPPDADLVIEIHYGPGGQGQVDDTFMNIQFVTNTEDVRPVYAGWLLTQSPPVLIDGPLVIPANELAGFHQVSAPLQNDLSVVSICPHMHYLGKSYRVWYETGDGIEYPLIDIPQWDFHWQKYYTFQTVMHIPAGAVIKSEGIYDNTLANHDNPSNPPVTVTAGPTTLDEMFLCYFIYANYEEGDEDIIMDSTILETTGIPQQFLSNGFSMVPNPTTGVFVIDLSEIHEAGSVYVYDHQGRHVAQYAIQEEQALLEVDLGELNKGVYLVQVKTSEGILTRKIVLQ